MSLTKELACESPIEERLAERLEEHFHPGVAWESQRWVTARGERFRVDFLAEYDGRRVVIECDGREFHKFNLDRRRDALMLNDRVAHDVFRFRGCDIYFAPQTCIDTLATFAPFLSDPSAKAPNLTDKVLLSATLRGRDDKPIHRATVARGEHDQLGPALGDIDTYSPMGLTTDRLAAVVQFKTPYWDQTYRGVKVWQIGDYMDFLNRTRAQK